MTFKDNTPVVCTEILSRRTGKKPADMVQSMQLFRECLPLVQPEKWGWHEPFNMKWNWDDLDRFLPDGHSGMADTVYWVGKGSQPCWGNFTVAWKSAVPHVALDTHSRTQLVCPLSVASTPPMVDYIQRSALALDVDIAHIHLVVDQEQELRTLEASYGGGRGFQGLSMNTHDLRHWLPEPSWAMIFGEAYVRMFGMDCLLNAPAYKVEKLSDEAVYVQLSPEITDLVHDFAKVDAVRQKVKDHLGRDAFFDPARAYPLRSPRGTFTPEEYRNFKKPAPVGTVFRVPDFRLIAD